MSSRTPNLVRKPIFPGSRITQLVVVLVSVFVIICSALFLLSTMRTRILSGVRVYVAGEGIWSKGQKDAVTDLLRYLIIRDRADYEAFQEAIALPLGDHIARLELEKASPDFEVAARGFKQGGNHPDDIADLIWFFRSFRRLTSMDHAVEIWTEADGWIAQLLSLGAEVDGVITTGGLTDDRRMRFLHDIQIANEHLTRLSRAFSGSLGEAGRSVDELLSHATYLVSTVLLGIGLGLSSLLLGHIRRGERVLRESEARAEDEAHVWSSLARLSRELIASLETPVILDRLCALAADMLGGDLSATFLRDADEGVIKLVAGHGMNAAARSSMMLFRPSEDVIREVMKRLAEHDVVVLADDDHDDPAIVALARRYGLSTVVYLALRRSGDLIGGLGVGYRQRTALSPGQVRLALGISQVSSLVLRNAQLMTDLEKANSVRAEFLANMSHELRTPIHAIIGYADLLREGILGELNDEQRSAIQRSARSARELLDLINATLDLSRLDQSHVPIEIKDVDLTSLLREIALEVDKLPRRADVALEFPVSRESLMLRTDDLKLRMVLKNLISNALKFTDHGRVAVSANALDGGIELAVADTGIGIPADKLTSIFEPFQQAAPEHETNGFGGVGLGLHLVRRLLEVLDGSVQVSSQLGQGSTFRVWLPRTGPKARAAAPLQI